MAKSNEQKLRYGPVAAAAATIGIYFLGQVAVGLFLVLGAVVLGADSARQFLQDSVWAQFGVAVVSSAAMLWLTNLFLKRRKTDWARIGLVRFKERDVGVAFLGFWAYLASVFVVMSLLAAFVPGIDLEQQQEIGFTPDTRGPALILVFISLVLLAPVVEEVLVRGVLFTGLRAKLSFWPAALVTSLLFGLAHLQLNDGQAPLWTAVADTFVLAMVLAYLRERTGGLWAPIILHVMKNGLAFVLLFVFRLA